MRIGITMDFSISFWANGMQQNIVFLYSLLKRIPDVDCFYLFNTVPPHSLDRSHKGHFLHEFIEDSTEHLDCLIIAGYDLSSQYYNELVKRNPKLKIILIHYGNKLFDDMHHSVGPETSISPVLAPSFDFEVWTSPHYEFAIPYLKSYYDTSKVYIAPYIWDPMFVQSKLKSLSHKKLNLTYSSVNAKKVCIFEPNKTVSKSCIIPLSIVNQFDSYFPSELESCSVFCTKFLRKKSFFQKYINRLHISNKNNFLYFNNRWSMTEACARYGNIIVSHQIANELNYLYFESLYLGFPLIHNSPTLSDYGYYYDGFNVSLGANQIHNAILNHADCLESYKNDNQVLFSKYSPFNLNNIKGYEFLLKDNKE